MCNPYKTIMDRPEPGPAVPLGAGGRGRLSRTAIDQDIADLQRLIHYVELRTYRAARRQALSAVAANTTATAEALLRKLRHALHDADQLRRTAIESQAQRANWAV
jgi:hypothetical protein